MKIVKFEIKSHEQVMSEFKEAWEAARLRLPYKPRIGASFTSLEAARNFLTPKRIEILHAIRTRRPRSIYELARQLKRNFASVFKDVDLLKRHGLLRLTKAPRSVRNAMVPSVGYEAIQLHIPV